MTCFWDGILANLKEEDFQRSLRVSKPNNRNLVDLLMKNNTLDTRNIIWNGKNITEQETKENYEHIKNFNINSIGNGYLCSSCDPFLILICELFKVNINHKYLGNMIKYQVNNPVKTLNFSSNRGHFTAC